MNSKTLFIIGILFFVAFGILLQDPGATSEMSPLGFVFIGLFIGGVVFTGFGFAVVCANSMNKEKGINESYDAIQRHPRFHEFLDSVPESKSPYKEEVVASFKSWIGKS
jgi:hypothetical protein